MQVDIIQSTFVPTSQGMSLLLFSQTLQRLPSEILRAVKILHGMQAAHAASKGAVGLEGEMVDAPMLKQVIVLLPDVSPRWLKPFLQAENTIRVAKAAGLDIPDISY